MPAPSFTTVVAFEFMLEYVDGTTRTTAPAASEDGGVLNIRIAVIASSDELTPPTEPTKIGGASPSAAAFTGIGVLFTVALHPILDVPVPPPVVLMAT